MYTKIDTSHMLPTWVQKHVDCEVLSQLGRYTTKHTTSNHVAILFKGRKVIAIGQNRLGGRHTIHAERDVIEEIGDTSKLRGATLVVIRIGGGEHGLMHSAPCQACQCLIQKCMRTYGLRGCIHS
jgi:hypothetical protein